MVLRLLLFLWLPLRRGRVHLSTALRSKTLDKPVIGEAEVRFGCLSFRMYTGLLGKTIRQCGATLVGLLRHC